MPMFNFDEEAFAANMRRFSLMPKGEQQFYILRDKYACVLSKVIADKEKVSALLTQIHEDAKFDTDKFGVLMDKPFMYFYEQRFKKAYLKAVS